MRCIKSVTRLQWRHKKSVRWSYSQRTRFRKSTKVKSLGKVNQEWEMVVEVTPKSYRTVLKNERAKVQTTVLIPRRFPIVFFSLLLLAFFDLSSSRTHSMNSPTLMVHWRRLMDNQHVFFFFFLIRRLFKRSLSLIESKFYNE